MLTDFHVLAEGVDMANGNMSLDDGGRGQELSGVLTDSGWVAQAEGLHDLGRMRAVLRLLVIPWHLP